MLCLQFCKRNSLIGSGAINEARLCSAQKQYQQPQEFFLCCQLRSARGTVLICLTIAALYRTADRYREYRVSVF